jgi:hypothetical protein
VEGRYRAWEELRGEAATQADLRAIAADMEDIYAQARRPAVPSPRRSARVACGVVAAGRAEGAGAGAAQFSDTVRSAASAVERPLRNPRAWIRVQGLDRSTIQGFPMKVPQTQDSGTGCQAQVKRQHASPGRSSGGRRSPRPAGVLADGRRSPPRRGRSSRNGLTAVVEVARSRSPTDTPEGRRIRRLQLQGPSPPKSGRTRSPQVR